MLRKRRGDAKAGDGGAEAAEAADCGHTHAPRG
jgi:hypothetical protein